MKYNNCVYSLADLIFLKMLVIAKFNNRTVSIIRIIIGKICSEIHRVLCHSFSRIFLEYEFEDLF
jgi:hypothetical protein